MPKCIFCDSERENEFEKKEHIIQEGIGGTLSSKNIVCENCNEIFSTSYDVEINDFYVHFTNILANWMPSRIRNKKITFYQDGIQWILSHGGMFSLGKKITKINDSSGNIKTIYATSKEEIFSITGNSCNSKIEEVFPSDDLVPDNILKIKKGGTEQLFFASLINLIEFAEYEASTNKRIGSIFSSKRFVSLKKKLISKQPFDIIYDTGYNSPFSHDLCLLNSLFPSTQNPLFCHRLIIDYQKEECQLVLSAQYFGTFPWIYIFNNVELIENSFCLTYYKDFEPQVLHEPNNFFFSPTSLLNKKFINYKQFQIKTQKGWEFATDKLHENYIKTFSQILFQYEQIDDSVYSETIEESRRVKKMTSKEAIEYVLSLKFRNVSLDKIQSISDKIGLEKIVCEKGNSAAYKFLAKELNQEFGYPEIMFKLSEGLI
ncbi:HNH endonuclease [Myxococcota bacterium]|nr:HNH endonuclease [Myxococcota bacterium]MBU1382946.1 HNH endonuclease [Myxococcota bacterium]MBU1496605.1 HNH endonuclease [Myxococcota bacterium]